MNTGRKRSALSYIPGYTNNAVLQLIIFSAVAYVIFALTWGVMMLVYQDNVNFEHYFIPAISLPTIHSFFTHWWTLITYGWFHNPHGFWELVSNMLWLYCFGSVVQMLVGHRQIIPLYAYSLIAGGVFYLIAQLLPGSLGTCPPYIMGPRAGLVGMAAAAVALTPKYRFYLTETFTIPIMVVAGVFAFLMIVSSGFYLPVVLLLTGGGLMGFGYVKLLKAGYRPGIWMYQLAGKAESLVTPNENASRNNINSDLFTNKYKPTTGISQKRIDDILDKINQKGYNSLSSEEKDVLLRAGKE